MVEGGEIHVFVGRDFVVTVRHGQASALGEVRAALDARPDLLEHGPGAVLYAIVDRIVDDYEPVVHGARDRHRRGGARRCSPPTATNPAERIYKLKRQVLEFHRAVAPLGSRRPARALQHDLVDPELRDVLPRRARPPAAR